MKSFVVDDKIHKEFKVFCEEKNININKSIEQILRQFLDYQYKIRASRQQREYDKTGYMKVNKFVLGKKHDEK